MIEHDILEILKNSGDDGSRLNAVVDEFRDGRDVNEILELLDSSNAELVSIGAWILSELHFKLYESNVFVCRLRELIEHEDPGVRFSALSALYPAMDPLDEATHELLNKLRNDPDLGVRISAEAIAARFIKDRTS